MSKEEQKKNAEDFLEKCKKFVPIKVSEPSKFEYKFDWSDKKQTCVIQSWEKETKKGMYCNVLVDTGKIAINAFIEFGSDTVVGGKIQ